MSMFQLVPQHFQGLVMVFFEVIMILHNLEASLQLALIQSNYLVSKLQEHRPDIQFETVTMSTPGDRDLSQSIVKIGESALWTLELENSLKSGRVDMIVHSLKDVSTSLPHGLVLGSILERANPRDAIVMSPQNHGHTLATLPNGSVIGTSSLRRAAQIRRSYPHLKIYDIRGNIDGRMQKLDESGQYDGLCLAAAALERMGAEYEKRTSQILSPEECMYAVSQAALAVECRANDVDGLNLLDNLHHRDTALRVVAERAYQKRLKAGCSEPVGAHSILKDGVLTLKGAVFTADGKEAIFDEETIRLPNGIKDGTEEQSSDLKQYSCIVTGRCNDPRLFQAAERLGTELADRMIKNGAEDILITVRKQIAAENAGGK
ncbi:porphobilinogen deaminase-like isoform X3 [Haliotis rufescens]|uniref:porphobilinogen deaminase-like isoform X3 n=1 Tax=Haliotis rufescens TaxID=6454 RepID=UPI001EAF9C1F|nr:porphobilinogen deaminase-like isoform X3 [Haliotis rufescens]